MVDNQDFRVPKHVPSHLVYDFDFLKDPRMEQDLHDGAMALLADAPPLFYTPRNGGHWVAAGKDVLFDIARKYEIFSNAAQSPDRLRQTVRIPIGLDPPQHTAYRQVLNQAFAPKAINALADSIRTLANELIDAVVDEGGCDFVPAVAEPLPVLIFMRMMGLPEDRFAEFREWVIASVGSYDSGERQRVFDKVLGMTGPLVEERMRRRTGDLISRIIDADVGGRPPNFEEIQSFCLMLFIAGLDTVVNGMSFGIRHLAADRALQERLRVDSSLIGATVEELLRRYSFTLPGRQVSSDIEYNGVPMKRGESVMLFIPAADLDGSSYPDPATIKLDRSEPHIAFGAGPHRCAGSHLARLELRILYEEWLRRVPLFRLDPDRPWRFHSALVFSVDSLPLLWDSPAAQA